MILDHYIDLGGGLDQRTPRHKMPEGMLIACRNVEPKPTRGYRRILGYVKYDTNVVPGEGQIRGVYKYGSKVYAWRNKTGGATAGMYWSTGSGWTEISRPYYITFTSGGTTEIAAGDTVQGDTSSAQGTATAVFVSSGTWAGGDAAGTIYFDSITGTFQAEELNTANATCAGAQTQYTLTPSGRVEAIDYDFAGTSKMYGVDGVNKGWEYDGTSYIPIHTGMAADTPRHLIAHRKHLFYSFARSVQHSGLGLPLDWTVVSGASEILSNDTITGYMQLAGGILGVFSRNRTMLLYGSSASDWTADALQEHGNKIGAIEWSLQQLGARTRYLDDRGVIDLRAAQEYGDFADAAISYLVEKFIDGNKDNVTASCIVRDKSQYRIFFSDGAGILFTFLGNKLVGAAPFLFPDVVRCVHSTENANGSEVIYFGSDDGYIYQMESGNAFDDTNIFAYMQTNYSLCRYRRRNKLFKRIVLDLKTTGNTTLNYKPFFFDSEEATARPIVVSGGASVLGSAALGRAILGGDQIQEGVGSIPGKGTEASMLFYTDSQTTGVWEIDGMTYEYLLGGRKRR